MDGGEFAVPGAAEKSRSWSSLILRVVYVALAEASLGQPFQDSTNCHFIDDKSEV